MLGAAAYMGVQPSVGDLFNGTTGHSHGGAGTRGLFTPGYSSPCQKPAAQPTGSMPLIVFCNNAGAVS